MTAKTKAKHPAPFSKEVVAAMREILLGFWPPDVFLGRPMIFDPYAGEGIRLADIAGAEFNYGGVEIEPSLIKSDRILEGDATDPTVYPKVPFVIATSPVYPNGVADNNAAKDESARYTYRTAVAAIEGRDRELHPNNMGQYGYRGTKRPEEGGTSKRREHYWRIARESVPHWQGAELVLVNVSDFIAKRNVLEPVVDDWCRLLADEGWGQQELHQVITRRMKNGENRNTRVPAETIIVATRGEYALAS